MKRKVDGTVLSGIAVPLAETWDMSPDFSGFSFIVEQG